MNDHFRTRTVVEGIAFVFTLSAFFFDIVGVFGLLFAIAGTLIAVAVAIGICWKRPFEDQTI
jgi:hypothetical protein